MTILSTSAGTVAAELTSLANTAFGVGSGTTDTQHTPPAAKEQEQS